MARRWAHAGSRSPTCSTTPGRSEPRRAAAEPRPARRGDAHRRDGARAIEGRAGDRLCRARLLRRAAEELHERLGSAVPERHAVRHGRALPCRADHPRDRLPVGARPRASPTSGTASTPSTASAAPTGCLSRAATATAARSTGAAAAARPSRSPATPPAPTRVRAVTGSRPGRGGAGRGERLGAGLRLPLLCLGARPGDVGRAVESFGNLRERRGLSLSGARP